MKHFIDIYKYQNMYYICISKFKKYKLFTLCKEGCGPLTRATTEVHQNYFTWFKKKNQYFFHFNSVKIKIACIIMP